MSAPIISNQPSKGSETAMATILAKIKIFDGKEDEFERIIQPLYADSHRLETGLRRYEYWRGAQPNHYYCLLAFDDYLAFMAHQTSDHHESPDFPSLLESIELEWLDPVAGASDLPPTEPQDIPDDAPDLMKQYASMQPVVMQDWWNKMRKS